MIRYKSKFEEGNSNSIIKIGNMYYPEGGGEIEVIDLMHIPDRRGGYSGLVEFRYENEFGRSGTAKNSAEEFASLYIR